MSSCHKKKKNKKQKRSLRFPTQQRRPTAVAVCCPLVIRRSYLHDGTTGSPICLPRPPTPTQAPPSFLKKKKNVYYYFFPWTNALRKSKRPRFQIYRADTYFWFVSCKFGRRRKKIWLFFLSFFLFSTFCFILEIFFFSTKGVSWVDDARRRNRKSNVPRPSQAHPSQAHPSHRPLPPGQEVQSDRVHYVPKSDCEAFALRMRTAHVIFFLRWHEKTWWCFFCIWQPPLNCCYAKLHFFLFFLKGRIIKK